MGQGAGVAGFLLPLQLREQRWNEVSGASLGSSLGAPLSQPEVIQLLGALGSMREVSSQLGLMQLEVQLGSGKIDNVARAFNKVLDRIIAQRKWVLMASVQIVDFETGLIPDDPDQIDNFLDNYFDGTDMHRLILVNMPEIFEVPSRYKDRVEIYEKGQTTIDKQVLELIVDGRFSVSVLADRDTGYQHEFLYHVVYHKDELDAYDSIKPVVLRAGREVARYGDQFAKQLRREGVGGINIAENRIDFTSASVQALLVEFVAKHLALQAVLTLGADDFSGGFDGVHLAMGGAGLARPPALFAAAQPVEHAET